MEQRLVGVLLGVLALVSVSTWPAVAGESGSVDAGRQVFQASCAMCHGQDATGMMGMHPSLRGATDRLTREGVEVTIRNGRDTQPPMPAFERRLNDEQIADVVAYIESLPAGPRNFGPGGEETDGGAMGDGGMMDGGMMMGGGLMMLVMVVLVLMLLALAVTGIVWFVRQSDSTGATSSSAREELDGRYAAGDIDRNDYLQRRRDLEG